MATLWKIKDVSFEKHKILYIGPEGLDMTGVVMVYYFNYWDMSGASSRGQKGTQTASYSTLFVIVCGHETRSYGSATLFVL